MICPHLRTAFTVLLVVLAGPAAPAEVPPAAAGPPDPVHARLLPNGLKVLFKEDHAVPLVALELWVRDGSAAEAPGEYGALHFLEHMLFKRAKPSDPGIDEEMESLGAALEASTSKDWCRFSTTVPTLSAEPALKLMAQMLSSPALPESEMAKERDVIAQEMLRTAADPMRVLQMRLALEAFGDHPYGRPPLGDLRQLATMKRDALLAQWQRHFRANNLALVVVGDWKPDEAMEAVTRTFGALPAPAGPRPSPSEPAPAWHPRKDPLTLTIRGSRAYSLVGFPAPAIKDRADVMALDLIAALLGPGPRGRLSRELSTMGLPPDVDVAYLTTRWPGILTLGVEVAPKDVPTAREAMMRVVGDLAATPVPEAELAQAKSRVVSGYLFETETYSGQAYSLGFYEVLGDYRLAESYVSEIQKVTAQDLLRVARKYLAPERAVLMEALPAPPPAESPKAGGAGDSRG